MKTKIMEGEIKSKQGRQSKTEITDGIIEEKDERFK